MLLEILAGVVLALADAVSAIGIPGAGLLHDALRDGRLFAAGLDVTEPEPPLAGNPLLALPNCIVAPHIASATVDARNAMAEIAADNLLLGLEGAPLRHCVNPG